MAFHPNLVEDFVEYQHPIQNKSALYEGGLVGMGNRVSEQGHPIGVPFGQDPEYDINHCDWMKLADVGGARDLEDEGHDTIVEAPE